MKKVILLLICLVLLSAGCVQKQDKASEGKNTSSAAAEKVTPEKVGSSKAVTEPLSAKIISPRPGDILPRNKEAKFTSIVEGGKEPYTYSWTSNRDGVLSTDQSFTRNASKLSVGEHDIILIVNDASGSSVQASVVAIVL